jgi:tRNA threonylcarbamoyladenosine biosynthesis protein TsaB
MLGLALDTSFLYTSIAIINNGKIVYYKNNNKLNKQAETLNNMMEVALGEACITFQDLEYIAVASGPGRFTGLRAGISAANALLFTLKIPLISISTFEAIAYNYQDKKIGIILEAGMSRLYFQSFYKGEAISDINAIKIEEAQQLKGELLLIGNVDLADTRFDLDACHVAKCADSKIKYDVWSSYIEPQYIINNYTN